MRKSKRMSVTVLLLMLLATIIVVCGFKASKGIGLGGEDVRVQSQEIGGRARSGSDYGPGNYSRQLEVGGLSRFYKIHVPPSYAGTTPVPVVLVFHGGAGYPDAVRYESGMDSVSDREGFLVVYPAGQPSGRLFTDRLLIWNDGRPTKGGGGLVNDVEFVQALLTDVQSIFKIDPRRIYAAGYSNGAQLTYMLTGTLSNRIAAIGAVGGQRPPGAFSPMPSRPISVIQFSGMEDKFAPYGGGSPPEGFGTLKFKTALLPVKQTIQAWVNFNGCPSTTPAVSGSGRAVKESWGPCKADTEVVLWTLQDGGHTWPGGKSLPAGAKMGVGNVNRNIFAAKLMWEFFKKHPLK